MHDTIVRLADVWKTCNKIRAATFRVGLNLWDWYRPLDPEGNSLISESKFVSILAGPLRCVIGLSDAEIAQLADYFRAQDGRIHYFQLCQIIHGEDAGGRDKVQADCVNDACPPPPQPICHTLDQWQMRRLCCVLATIAERELPLKPYFQDYELVAKNDGRMTLAHFSRILNFVGVMISPEDFNLLVRRFIKDSYTIDYVEFLKALQAVKNEGIQGLGPAYKNPNAVLQTTLPKLPRPEIEANIPVTRLGTMEIDHPVFKQPRPTRKLIEIMLRIQEHIKKRSIRVAEFFRDFDTLNCGRITPQEFRRGMDAIGLGSILTTPEILCVMRHYMDPNDNDRLCWRTFEDDIDQVFAIKELEKHPNASAEPMAQMVAELPPTGALECITEGDIDLSQAALLRVRAACKERSIDLRPAFGEHDIHNNGHVSRAETRRVMARYGVLPTAAQMRALELRYLDDCGFNYFKFLDELEDRSLENATIAGPSAPPKKMSKEKNPLETDIVQILAKIKGKIVREGIRPRDFLAQFDKHRELVIPRADFYRGLGMAGISLTPLEMDTIMEVFCSPTRRRLVEYERFSACVMEALTQGGLERAPLLEPVPHVPPRDSPHNFLNYEERAIVSSALTKLSKYPDSLSNIIEVFRDLDIDHCGTVLPLSFDRALSTRGMLQLLSTREREVIYKCFGYPRGCGNQINYIALCNALDALSAAGGKPC